ncbi:unnamed protein product [Caenorhabditis brenneri]
MSNSTLEIESRNKNKYHCGPDQRIKGSTKLAPPIFFRLIDINSSSFQNCVSILKHLQNMISFKSLILFVNLEVMTVPFFKEILTEPALKDFECLSLDRGKIDAECLDLVMGMAHSNRDLHIHNTKVPENYHHKNAFKFYYVYYKDARWVRIEDVFTSKNSYAAHLGWNKFTNSDMKNYIKYWIESDHDMVETLAFFSRQPIQPESLFDGIVALKNPRHRAPSYLVATNRTKRRKYQLMGVLSYADKIYFYCKDMSLQSDGNVDNDSWEPEYKALMILNEKKELEAELKEIQKLLETSQDQNMVKRKNEIERELQNVSQELAGYNLVFRDGVYSYE